MLKWLRFAWKRISDASTAQWLWALFVPAGGGATAWLAKMSGQALWGIALYGVLAALFIAAVLSWRSYERTKRELSRSPAQEFERRYEEARAQREIQQRLDREASQSWLRAAGDWLAKNKHRIDDQNSNL